MSKAKVIKVGNDIIFFGNGMQLCTEHYQDCCENHYWSLKDLTIEDFKDLEFDLNPEEENFFKRIPEYGIELVPLHGHSVKIPAYGDNNGFYSSNLDLVLSNENGLIKEYDISECQDY